MAKSAYIACAQFFSERPTPPKFEEELRLSVNTSALKGMMIREGIACLPDDYELVGGALFVRDSTGKLQTTLEPEDVKALIMRHAQLPILLLGLSIARGPAYDFRNHSYQLSFRQNPSAVEKVGSWQNL